MSLIADNLTKVRIKIAAACKACGRNSGSVKLMAVSKTKTVKMIEEALTAGQRDFGENYAQE